MYVKQTRLRLQIFVFGLFLGMLLPVPAQTQTLSWKRQLGTSGYDVSYGVATDSNGNVYISGYTDGSVDGANQGSLDAWVAKYNTSGTLLWKRQLGTSANDVSYGVATDSNGDVYISGDTDGSIDGSNQGLTDAWVAKYNSSGVLIGKRQLGTSTNDMSRGVATDSKGNFYISGFTAGSLGSTNQGPWDAWVAKYNSSGTLVWKRQLGTSVDDVSKGVATDGDGNVYISGFTQGSLAGAFQGGGLEGTYDAWVAKYNSSGTLVWKRQLGTSSTDTSNGVATDSSGNVYISGQSYGSLGGSNQGLGDAWVAKYNSSGTLLWKRQLGTSSQDASNSVATDSNGNVYMSGFTTDSLEGANQGSFDAWVAKYNSNGALLWKLKLGTPSPDASNGVATDRNGNVYMSGDTAGSLGGDYQGGSQGSTDAWVVKYTQ